MRRRDGARQRILDAAERLVLDEGASHLTLDAAAARAGVSKGGLLYHFPTKQALLQAMVERLCSTFEARMLEHVRPADGPAGALAAYVSTALDREANGSVASALLAAVANDPKLLEANRAHLRRWLPHLAPEAPFFSDRAIVWLATEGLWLLELLDLSPLEPRQRREIAARLSELSRGGEFAPATPERKPDGAARRRGETRRRRVLTSSTGGER